MEKRQRRKLTPAQKRMIKFLQKNKTHYKDSFIEGKQVWGIGPKAITLVDRVVSGDGYLFYRHYEGEKEFHNFQFGDGAELAEEILTSIESPYQKWRKTILRAVAESEAQLINSSIQERIDDKYYISRLKMAYGD